MSRQHSTAMAVGEIFLFVLLVSGYARHTLAAELPSGQAGSRATEVSALPGAQGGRAVAPANELLLAPGSSGEDFIAALAKRGSTTAECFQLRPGSVGKKGAKAMRCEPQSLPFARCRSGIASCRIGHENGPLTWFACEKERGNTSLAPRPGSILILAANGRRKMPTGHVAYVEEVEPQSATVYRLVFTHTNYDRRCSLESNVEATYDSVAQTLDIHGGAWRSWGKGLPVAGFILE